ncbi:phosphate ABC transporter permease subunit PstC [Cellulomonas sp. zg-ZUI222]|uniref:Phosphate transport system permease protein n=1 Tax=Cellulomonas wangleii TaxID=2816956 RepID=A0ABX8D818_9CELL|nr:phosphate ABC transporter permease subunit PstC [Cellulomonas sp. zg-ZUI22]MBO0921766.1 phosphate ABC transporter permease subunit PstC [Cellulomonas wangleii]MBO0924812.1 phosphate ABC transporter permease subunit PstC [Cellulomonas wangleii]QVI62980.1 phosphate ABC transporter permease subunit PstC [Cellulomonas wangleii]
MAVTTTPPPRDAAPQARTDAAEAVRAASTGRLAGRVFAGLSTGAGILILVTLAAVAVFLVARAWPALTASREELDAISWFSGGSVLEYVGPLVFGTLLASLLALVMAVPVSVGIALFISHYAPRRLAQGLGYLIDLLAAIPSVVYGLWGALWLIGRLDPVFAWVSTNLGFIPFFADYQAPAKNIMSASVVLAVMILPIITAVSREVFLQTPRLHEEASLALGATRWEMVRQAVLPFGRSGVISASMLGLGRALGETMAVLMVISPGFLFSFFLLKPGQQQTIAANIASKFPEASGLSVSVLVATGLALFVITFVVNFVARWIIARRAEFSGAN